MFDSHSYAKGGRILHLLRCTVGDEAFFEALKQYLSQYAYKTAEIEDLRLVFERVTGQDLHWFFDQWFMQAGHPVLEVSHDFGFEAHCLRNQLVHCTIMKLDLTRSSIACSTICAHLCRQT